MVGAVEGESREVERDRRCLQNGPSELSVHCYGIGRTRLGRWRSHDLLSERYTPWACVDYFQHWPRSSFANPCLYPSSPCPPQPEALPTVQYLMPHVVFPSPGPVFSSDFPLVSSSLLIIYLERLHKRVSSVVLVSISPVTILRTTRRTKTARSRPRRTPTRPSTRRQSSPPSSTSCSLYPVSVPLCCRRSRSWCLLVWRSLGFHRRLL